MSAHEVLLKELKMMVVSEEQLLPNGQVNCDFIDLGVVLNFTPTENQKKTLEQVFEPLNVTTLFSKSEAETEDPFDLIYKQVVHYIDVYLLGNFESCDSIFNFDGTTVSIKFIRGVTEDQIGDLIRDVLYENRPVKEPLNYKMILDEFKISYDINKVKNNELRIILFDVDNDVLNDGDDAARAVCYLASGNAMLIKSKEMLNAIKDNKSKIPSHFFERHEIQLSKVFNRHKDIILSAKGPSNKTAINRIARLSKKNHTPMTLKRELSVLTDYAYGEITMDDFRNVIIKTTVRDKMKFLNHLAYKKEQSTDDVFCIRNGKLYIRSDRKIWPMAKIDEMEKAILLSLEEDLAHLKGRKILLDNKIKYGLPVSRKQTIGNLSYGSTISIETGMSVGIYWKNEWGSCDLDLSLVNGDGERYGWGQFTSYNTKNNSFTFSGDVTSAPEGAMEFFTFKDNINTFGLLVNIFNGSIGSKMRVVIGKSSERNWIDDIFVEEEMTLRFRENFIGLIDNGKFIVYGGSTSNQISSFRTNINQLAVKKGKVDYWTVDKLFDYANIAYDLERDEEYDHYDHDLTYDRHTFDALESLMFK